MSIWYEAGIARGYYVDDEALEFAAYKFGKSVDDIIEEVCDDLITIDAYREENNYILGYDLMSVDEGSCDEIVTDDLAKKIDANKDKRIQKIFEKYFMEDNEQADEPFNILYCSVT